MNLPALIFDLDGTLVDSVYEHVTAWHRAFRAHGVTLPAFEYHKRIGMTGAALVESISDAFDLGLSQKTRTAIEAGEALEYHKHMAHVRGIAGIEQLWKALEKRGLRFAIATSADSADAKVLLKLIDPPRGTIVVTKEDESESKPSPEPFARAAQELGVELGDSIIVGDAVWDMLSSRRAGALGVGVLTGGYGRQELVAAGAYRVYRDVVELSQRFTELGISGS